MTTRVYTKVARAAAEERTREALLDAAEAAFFAKRWEDIKLADVARDAGTTKQTLLRHFGSKEGLLDAGFARATAAVKEQRMDAPRDDIEAAVDNLLDHYDERGDRGLRLEAMDGHPVVERHLASGRALHHGWVDHAFSAWLMDAPERESLRGALIALCDVHAWRILRRDLGMTRAKARAALILSIRRLLMEET